MAKRGRPFEAGNEFGRGRPLGSRNKNTLIIEELLNENSESLLNKALNLARQGNIPMLRLLLDRVLPRPKDGAVSIGLLPMATTEDLLRAQENALQELALGQITPNQAAQIFSLIEARRLLLDTHEYEQGMRAALEQRMLGGAADKAGLSQCRGNVLPEELASAKVPSTHLGGPGDNGAQ